MKLTPENSEIKPDTKIKISGYEFTLFKEAFDDAFRALSTVTLPEQYKVIDQYGEPVEEFTQEQLNSGELRRVIDVSRTFSGANAQVNYSGNISHIMLEAKRMFFEIQDRETKKGNAVSIQDLMAEMEAPKLEKINE